MSEISTGNPIIAAWISEYVRQRGGLAYPICSHCKWPHAPVLTCGGGATFGRAKFGESFVSVDSSNVSYLLNLRLSLARGFHWKDDIYFEQKNGHVVVARVEYFNGIPAVHEWRIPNAEWRSIELAVSLSALTARSEGFREGVEAAARVCEGYAQEGERTGKEYVHETIAELVARLRALSPRETDADPQVQTADKIEPLPSPKCAELSGAPGPAASAEDTDAFYEEDRRLDSSAEEQPVSAPSGEVAEMMKQWESVKWSSDPTVIAKWAGQAAALLSKVGQGWVPASERLPIDGLVLATDGKEVAIYTVGAVIEYAKAMDHPLTHWMPLPPPPERP